MIAPPCFLFSLKEQVWRCAGAVPKMSDERQQLLPGDRSTHSTMRVVWCVVVWWYMQCHPFPLLSLSHLPPSPLPSHFPPLTYYLIVLLIHFSHSIYPARYGSGVGDPGSGEGKRHGLPTRRRCTSLLTHSILSSPLFSYRLFSLQSFPLLTHGNSSLPSSSSLLPSVSPPVSTFVLFSPPVCFSSRLYLRPLLSSRLFLDSFMLSIPRIYNWPILSVVPRMLRKGLETRIWSICRGRIQTGILLFEMSKIRRSDWRVRNGFGTLPGLSENQRRNTEKSDSRGAQPEHLIYGSSI